MDDVKQSHTGQKKTHKKKSLNKKLIKYEQIENTPFTIVSREGIHFLAIGNNRVSEETNDKEKLKELVEKRDYHVLGAMITVITQSLIEIQQNKQTGL